MAWAFVAKVVPLFDGDSRAQPSLRARAMRLLARREHSRAELQRKLSAVAEEGDNVEALLDDLAKKGWLSDARFAEQTIRSKARRFGPLKARSLLRGQGLDEETIAAAFRAAGTDGGSSIEMVWRSRFHEPPAGDREKARQVRFLQGRGFSLDDILKFLKRKP
jgi:regulatory protein